MAGEPLPLRHYGGAVASVPAGGGATPPVPAAVVGWRPLLAVAGVVVVVLVLTAGRYGYHRDELYFLTAG